MVDTRNMYQFINREEEEKVTQELAEKLQLNYINLADYNFAPGALLVIPKEIVEKLYLVSYLRQGNELRVATVDPSNPELKKFVKEFGEANNYKISLSVCSPTSYRYAKAVYELNVDKETEARSVRDQAQKKEESFVKGFTNKEEFAAKLSKTSTSELIDMLFAGGIVLRASDIHLEPTESMLIVRFRIDGILQNVANLNLDQYKLLRSRIKYLSKMKLNVVAEAQDGRFEFKEGDKKIDVRVSAVPTPFGETFVMRLLNVDKTQKNLDDMGFSPEQIKIIREAIAKPNGIIINTGPTGSGKSTTLYAILMELNKPDTKIITIENPIEYRIPGITQTQVEQDKSYDFATALKSAMRQDPDILMVGEIRDPETTSTAIQAAVTGHLVLTTLHTNSAAAAIPRLIDLGAKPYLLGGTINLIIAQRLVRKVSRDSNGQFSGRIAIAELLVPNQEIETLIQQKASVDQFNQAAKRSGMKTLYEDGLEKVKMGITTEEEINRVAAK